MAVLNGKLEGKTVVLDEVPQGIPSGARVRVILVEEGRSIAFETIAAMAVDGGLPPDFAAQHHHYTEGLPKR